MAWDLEGLVSGLVVLVSCAGEQGEQELIALQFSRI